MNIFSIFSFKLIFEIDSNLSVNSNKFREPVDVLIFKSGQRESPVIILGFEKPGRSTKRTIFLKG